MKTSIFITLKFILIIIALGVAFSPFFCPEFKLNNSFIILIFGVNQIILVIGLLSLVYLLTLLYFKHLAEKEKMDYKNNEEEKRHNQFKEDLKLKQETDEKRNTISDLFKLIELAKNKPEKLQLTENVANPEKPYVRIIEKSEGLDMEKLDKMITYYKEIILAK